VQQRYNVVSLQESCRKVLRSGTCARYIDVVRRHQLAGKLQERFSQVYAQGRLILSHVTSLQETCLGVDLCEAIAACKAHAKAGIPAATQQSTPMVLIRACRHVTIKSNDNSLRVHAHNYAAVGSTGSH
jgi:hypothetical protein